MDLVREAPALPWHAVHFPAIDARESLQARYQEINARSDPVMTAWRKSKKYINIKIHFRESHQIDGNGVPTIPGDAVMLLSRRSEMNTVHFSGKKGVVSLVLLAALIILVHPVAAGEEGAGPSETCSPETCPSLPPLENFTIVPASKLSVWESFTEPIACATIVIPKKTAPPPCTHPRDWYVSPVPGTGNPHAYENLTSLLEITNLGAGDTIHLWGVEGHTYEGGIAIDAPDVTVKRWEGSPAQPLVTTTSHTTPAFTVTADHATFLDLDISGNRLENGNGAGVYAIGDVKTPLKGLTILDCTFTRNTVEEKKSCCGAADAVGGDITCGGAVFAEYVDDILVEGTTFAANTALWDGGGVWFENCDDATITTTSFINNTATEAGGGAHLRWCENAAVTASSFTTNAAGHSSGGAHFLWCDLATLTDLTFTENTAQWSGGGVEISGSNNATLTNLTFIGNTAQFDGGGAHLTRCDDATVTTTSFTTNTAKSGGGADLIWCENATISATTFINNSALGSDGGPGNGGGAHFIWCENTTITATSFIANLAHSDGDGVYIIWCDDATIVNCRFDNLQNIFGYVSTAVLNATRMPGTNIAGGPYLGGNLWLQDPEQNISEWGPDADFDGICDQAQTIETFSTDHLPLVYGGDRGTVLVRPSAYGGYVHVDGVNTTRAVDSSAPCADAFFLPAGTHTIEVVGATTYGRASVEVAAGTTESVTVEVEEGDVEG
ncbi:MAG: NosD domain-containing protein [Methanofollis sp.]|nr:NosD domain-containing protein [Methanofollis sp.]